MPTTPRQTTQSIDRSCSPRWTWHTLLLVGGVAGLIYSLLPMLDRLAPPPEAPVTLRKVDVIPPPPAPPPPELPTPAPSQPTAVTQATPVPQLATPAPKIAITASPLHVTLDPLPTTTATPWDFDLQTTLSAQSLAGMTFELTALDEIPRATIALDPAYPLRARSRGIEGEVILEFTVSTQGTTQDIVVLSETPKATFTAAATRAIARWRFTPGKKDGQAVATRMRQKVSFVLQ